MTCPRCQGLMVADLSCDLEETQGIWVKTTRCMNCGHVTDPTIEKNRLRSIPQAVQSPALSEMAHAEHY